MGSSATYEEVLDMVMRADLPKDLMAGISDFLSTSEGLNRACRAFGVLKAAKRPDAVTDLVQRLLGPPTGSAVVQLLVTSSTSLLKRLRALDRVKRVDHSWEGVPEGPRATFLNYWDTHGDAIMKKFRNKLLSRACGEEPDRNAYKAGALLLDAIFGYIKTRLSISLSSVYFLDKTDGDPISSCKPDMIWMIRPADIVVQAAQQLAYADIVWEFKDSENKLDGALGQVIDRAHRIRDGRASRSAQPSLDETYVLGAATTGSVMRAVTVCARPDNRCTEVCFTPDYVVSNTAGRVNVDGSAFKEMVFQVHYACLQHGVLAAAAEPRQQVQPDDILQVSVTTAASGSSSSSGDGAAPLELRVVALLVPARPYSAVLQVEAVAGPLQGQRLLLKLGAQPAYKQAALQLGDVWLLWSQVQVEIAARSQLGANVPHVPAQLLAGSVAAIIRQGAPVLTGWVGAPLLVTELTGAPLVDLADGRLPVLPPSELTALTEALVAAVEHMQACGVFHNDIHPRNIGVERSPCGGDPKFYVYDLGVASCTAVDELAQRELPCTSLWPTSTHSQLADLEYSSTRALVHDELSRDADLESVLFTVIRLSGFELPWTRAAAANDLEGVLAERATAMANVESIGWFKELQPAVQALARRVAGQAGAVQSMQVDIVRSPGVVVR